MSNYNKETLLRIGKLLKKHREERSFSQGDVATMTGLTITTIFSVEKGRGTSLSNFLLICQALGIQPRDIFVKDLVLTPPFEAPPGAGYRNETARKLDELVYSNFFDTPKRVSDVLRELEIDKKDSNKFSVYLTAYCKEGALEYVKEKNIKKYSRKKSGKAKIK
ncbi:helix-turn-helix transcriptional regulator [Sphingobacterium psychroaquaticum]|uniref:DNA-binding transcriptional regulator, XRE-family HTH domain n=1 Tax=Sphingobacterium psychroaquaticum TaxID=561061 RepID=A0A1X7JS57_9SPHI|nr:helix-turn-helix domain-containing protein [Sphingobacterium psychroaquaticum]SMG31221.1 DNA-binding transcriptional regulator, XRE-family HTH domain [Sphingobacterium psychroaquaticum]